VVRLQRTFLAIRGFAISGVYTSFGRDLSAELLLVARTLRFHQHHMPTLHTMISTEGTDEDTTPFRQSGLDAAYTARTNALRRSYRSPSLRGVTP
jgi:hypothetical protein